MNQKGAPRATPMVLSSDALVTAAALVLGSFAGWLDLTNTEVQVPALAVLVFAFTLGLVRPSRAWLSALLIGICIPAAQAIGLIFAFRAPYGIDASTLRWSFLALVPAAIGALLGAVVRRLVPRPV